MGNPKNKQKPWYKRWWAILIYIFIALMLIQIFIIIPLETKEDAIKTGQDTTTVKQEPVKRYLDESLNSIYSKFSSKSSLTDLQKEEMWKEYNGKLIKSKVYVHSVDDVMLTGLVMLADLKPRSQYDVTPDLRILFKDEEKPSLLTVSEGDAIWIEGKLNDYGGIISDLIEIKDAKIVEEGSDTSIKQAQNKNNDYPSIGEEISKNGYRVKLKNAAVCVREFNPYAEGWFNGLLTEEGKLLPKSKRQELLDALLFDRKNDYLEQDPDEIQQYWINKKAAEDLIKENMKYFKITICAEFKVSTDEPMQDFHFGGMGYTQDLSTNLMRIPPSVAFNSLSLETSHTQKLRFGVPEDEFEYIYIAFYYEVNNKILDCSFPYRDPDCNPKDEIKLDNVFVFKVRKDQIDSTAALDTFWSLNQNLNKEEETTKTTTSEQTLSTPEINPENPCKPLEDQCLKQGDCTPLKEAREAGKCDEEGFYSMSTTSTETSTTQTGTNQQDTTNQEQDSNLPAPPGEYDLSVPGGTAWYNAGVNVNSGSTLSIIASGNIKISGSDPGWSPDGVTETNQADVEKLLCPLTNKAYGLIGKIGQGTCFFIGSSKTFTADNSGTLYLSVNDRVGTFGDNSGSWTVNLEVN